MKELIENFMGSQVKWLRKKKGMTQKQLAEDVGVSISTIHRLERGDFSGSHDTITEIARVLGVPVWSLYKNAGQVGGTSVLPPCEAHVLGPTASEDSIILNILDSYRKYDDNRRHSLSEFTFIPKFQLIYDANQLVPLVSEKIEEPIAIKTDDFEKIYKISLSSVIAVDVIGDIMTPTLDHGDIVFVNTACRDIRIEGIFVFAKYNELYIKRLQLLPNGDVIVSPDNHAYQAYTIQKDELESLNLVGRVIGAYKAFLTKLI